jgi:hypothetical protein
MNASLETVTIQSWSHLQDELFADSWNAKIGRFRSHHAFRGLSDARYPLITTLMRLGGRFDELERHLVRNFRKYAHGSVVERDSFWHWVSVAQHYGLPTRLLDWTNSPYVALHFATANVERFHVDGAIWVVDHTRVHRELPGVLREALDEEGASIFTVEMLSERVASFEEMARISPDPFVLFFEPPSIDPRIYHQYAFFSVASDNRLALDHWLGPQTQVARKLIIPARLKWEVRDKVDLANINERTLFPGLEGLCRWLRRYYSPSMEWTPGEEP